MYHSITFGEKNTYDDWHLAPSSRPVISPPKLKQKYIDIPGSNGILDLTESLTSFPVYENREGDIEFFVLNDFEDWQVLYSEIMDYIHGRRMRAVLEDDPAYYYEGRFTVKNWKSEAYWSKIVITYNVSPYKYKTQSSIEENWLWDIFNFETDYISVVLFKNLQMTGNWITYTFSKGMYGSAPICPKFIVSGSSNVSMKFVNQQLSINETVTLVPGTNEFLDLLFSGDSCTVSFLGNSSSYVSIEFNQGRL